MRRCLMSLGTSALLLGSAVLARDEPRAPRGEDSVAEALEKAKGEYRSIAEEAAKRLIADFAEEEKRLKGDATLAVEEKIARIERLRGELAAFKVRGQRPGAEALKGAADRFQEQVRASRAKCEKAFDAAADAALQDDLERAKAIVIEKRRFFQSPPLPPEGDAASKDEGDFGEAKFQGGEEVIRGAKVKVGSPQFTLLWDTRADLDLHVIEPGGAEIYWENRNGKKGGELDVDDVDGFGPENVFFPADAAPKGEYRWFVHYYGGLGGVALPTRWTVRVKHDGKVKLFKGNLPQIGARSGVNSLKVD